MRISQTIAQLAARRTASGDFISGEHLEELRSFGGNPGQLRGYVYAPAQRDAAAPMVVVLHGCTQSAAGYDRGAGWSALAERHGFVVLLPEQQRANNPNGCFNWFAADDVRRGSGEVESIRQMIVAATATYGVDPDRVFVTGLSAGGAMAAATLATYPELFAGGAVIAGLPYGVAASMPEAFERMQGRGGPRGTALGKLVRSASGHRGPWPTLSVWHGTADRTVNPTNADLLTEQWTAVHGVGPPDRTTAVDGYPRTVWRDAAGRAVVERFEITGMGHGTPLSTGGADGLGVAGPFMLETSISSTRHIARFWGLVEEAEVANDSAPARARVPAATTAALAGPARIIDDALRAAGLIR